MLKCGLLLQSDERKLQALHMTYQRRILGACWYDFFPDAVIAERTSLLSSLRKRRLAIFGHVHRLPETIL